MDWSSEWMFAVAMGVVAFLAGLLMLGRKASRTRRAGHRSDNAPENLRYTCAGCHGKFTHSRRTLAAWEKGAKSFYCNACHTRSVTVPKPKPWQLVPGPKGGKGCLSVVVLMVVVPLACVAAWQLWALA